MRAVKAPLWQRETPRRPAAAAPPWGDRPGRAPWGFAAAFLLGYLPGILAGRAGRLPLGSELAAYYMDGQRFASFGPVLASLFGTAFLQLTLTMLCGFSAIGMPALALLFLLRGAFLGLGASSVFVQGGAKALVIHWLLSFLPELTLLLLALWLSGYAAQLAGGLFREVFGGGAARNALFAAARRVLVRYFVVLLASGVICLLGAGLAVLFAGVLL